MYWGGVKLDEFPWVFSRDVPFIWPHSPSHHQGTPEATLSGGADTSSPTHYSPPFPLPQPPLPPPTTTPPRASKQ